MCEALGTGVGVVVDLWHVWWDPNLRSELMRAGGENLFALHICDWRAPLLDRFQDRAMMGDGMINIPEIEGWMREAGFTGWTEIEIFSAQDWWKRDVVERLKHGGTVFRRGYLEVARERCLVVDGWKFPARRYPCIDSRLRRCEELDPLRGSFRMISAF